MNLIGLWGEIENLKKTVRELHQENQNISTTITSQDEDIYVLTSKLKELVNFVRAQDMSGRIMEFEEKSRTDDELLKEAKKFFIHRI